MKGRQRKASRGREVPGWPRSIDGERLYKNESTRSTGAYNEYT